MDSIRPWLFVGTYREACNPGLLRSKGIGAMLLVANDVQHHGITTNHLPIEDAEFLPGITIREGVDFVLGQKGMGKNVLIACVGGISRSVAFAVAALKEDEGLTLGEALDAVKERHPEADPHPVLWESLCEHYQEGGRWRGKRERRRT